MAVGGSFQGSRWKLPLQFPPTPSMEAFINFFHRSRSNSHGGNVCFHGSWWKLSWRKYTNKLYYSVGDREIKGVEPGPLLCKWPGQCITELYILLLIVNPIIAIATININIYHDYVP